MAITATLDIRLKADKLDTAFEVIHETLAGTRAFPGCLGVSVLVDSADPAHVILLETWESAEHDNAYRKWRATAKAPRSSAPCWPPRPASPCSRSPRACDPSGLKYGGGGREVNSSADGTAGSAWLSPH